MIRTYLIPLLAICGVVFAVTVVIRSSRPPIAQPPAIEPPRAPFAAFVAGSGIIEANTQNISIGSPVGDIVMSVPVQVGQNVKKGDTLFELDSRSLNAQLVVNKAAVAIAEQTLAKLNAGTRAELIPAARARVTEATAMLQDAQDQLALMDKLSDPRARSQDEINRRRYAASAAEARLAETNADLQLLNAGTWKPDIDVAQSQLELARANVQAVQIELDRRVVRSPIDGRLLQVNIRAGEFAPAGTLATPLMLMGSVSPLHVRVDIDEHDAWRVKAGRKALAYARGNKDISTALEFVRFEPYVVPKRSLTGDSSERVDTRVLQVIYRFDPANLALYVGQQVDVFIEAEPVVHSASSISAPVSPTSVPTTSSK